MKRILAAGAFDDIRARHFRFFEEASKLGELNVILWADEIIKSFTGNLPKFPAEERMYLLKAIRYIKNVFILDANKSEYKMKKLIEEINPDIYVTQAEDRIKEQDLIYNNDKIIICPIPNERLNFINTSTNEIISENTQKKKVIVTGCYDWFHSGHVAFFEEASQYGDLYVILGSDRNVRLLKGDKHPMFNEKIRRYIVQSIRYVKQAFISSGTGWMDAEPEIMKLKPDIYIVNEDGDVSEKREFCKNNNIEYVVLERVPKSGLPKRTSTVLRNF
jgi:cytidyltransferase-like protein